ncbi:phytanoyl-CoA dioxygenase [Syncephalis plumigaleata]|nr:phytanoyl-CoA dioxygenase [Syncephalis plumigaleata]
MVMWCHQHPLLLNLLTRYLYCHYSSLLFNMTIRTVATCSFTEEQARLFNEQGFISIPGFLTSDDIQQAKQRIQHHIDAWQPEEHPLVAFTTDRSKHVRDEYFITSGDKIRYFLEEEALKDNKLVVSKDRAINKIGHALHALDPVFKRLTSHPTIKQAAKALGYIDPLVVQSMAILKQPRIGGEVKPHQDSSFLYTDPLSAIGFWIPLEDCTAENGCLHFIPGSHKEYPIMIRALRNDTGGIDIVGDPLPSIDHSRYVKVDCPAGSLVVIHGGVIHRSDANLSDHSRWAYTFHLVEGQAKYSDKNWLQPSEVLPFSHLHDM